MKRANRARALRHQRQARKRAAAAKAKRGKVTYAAPWRVMLALAAALAVGLEGR